MVEIKFAKHTNTAKLKIERKTKKIEPEFSEGLWRQKLTAKLQRKQKVLSAKIVSMLALTVVIWRDTWRLPGSWGYDNGEIIFLKILPWDLKMEPWHGIFGEVEVVRFPNSLGHLRKVISPPSANWGLLYCTTSTKPSPSFLTLSQIWFCFLFVLKTLNICFNYVSLNIKHCKWFEVLDSGMSTFPITKVFKKLCHSFVTIIKSITAQVTQVT